MLAQKKKKGYWLNVSINNNIKSDENNKLMRKIIFSRVNNLGYEAYINERKIC